MKTIWKFPFSLQNTQIISMPSGAEILSVADQGGTLCLWAAVDASAPTEKRMFEIVGTGGYLHPETGTSRRFISTVLQGSFVWHVFELR